MYQLDRLIFMKMRRDIEALESLSDTPMYTEVRVSEAKHTLNNEYSIEMEAKITFYMKNPIMRASSTCFIYFTVREGEPIPETGKVAEDLNKYLRSGTSDMGIEWFWGDVPRWQIAIDAEVIKKLVNGEKK